MKKILVILLALFCVALAIVNTAWFKNRLFDFVTNRIEHTTGMHVTIGGFNYTFPLRLTLHNIALGSPEDPDLTIAEINLHASVSALWRNQIKIHNLKMDHVIVHRAVQFPESQDSNPPKLEIPIPFKLSHFQINDLVLDPRIPPLNIDGNLEAKGAVANGFININFASFNVAMDVDYAKEKGLAVIIQEAQTGPLIFGGQFNLSPDLKLDRTRFHVQLNNIRLLERWIPLTMHGKLAATCELEGPVQRPHASVDLNSKRLFVFGYAWENFKTSLNCLYEEKKLTGSINLASRGADYHIHSNTDFEWRLGQLLRLPTLIMEGPRSKVRGSFFADLVTGGIESEMEGSTDDLALLQEILNDTATGSIAFKSKFAMTPEGGQNVDLTIQGENIQLAAFEAGKGEIEIHGEHLNTNPKAAVKLKVGNFLWNSLRMEELTAETMIDTSIDVWPFQVAGRSTDKLLSRLAARGSWHKDENSILIAVDTCDGELFEQETAIKEPVTIRILSEVLNISPIALQFGQAKLFTTVDLSRQNFGSTVHLEDFPLELIQKIDPSLPLSGKLDAAFTLRGDPAQPEGRMEIQLTDLKISENVFSKLPKLHGIIKAELKENQLSCSGTLEGFEEQPIQLDAKLPIHVSFYPMMIHFNSDEELAAQFRIKGDVIPLLQLFVDDANTLRGETDLEIDIAGTFSNPQLSGKAVFQKGNFESIKTGAVFKDINAIFEASGNEIRLKELTASDRYDGKLTGQGTIKVDPSEHFPYQFDFNVVQTRFFNLDFADAVFSGKARLEGTTEGGQLTGKLDADRLAIVIPEQLPTAAHHVDDVTFVNIPKGQKKPSYNEKNKNEWPLKLDLNLSTPNNASITGTNLKTTWKGAVNVLGTAENPEVHGELKVAQGSYIFNGKEFQINQGTITFAGDPEKKTSLYVIASYDLGKIIAEIILRGSIKNPTISFRSNPPLSQREIVAWLLFGRGVSDISATEGQQLNQSITNLKSNNSGPDMLTKLRTKMGIDRIDINRGDNEDSNQVSVQVGKYISQGVYVSVNKSVTAESNQVCLEANLTREFKVQAEVGDDQEGQLLLKWKRDY